MSRRYQREIEEILQTLSSSDNQRELDRSRPGRVRKLLGNWYYDATSGVWLLRPTGIFLGAVAFLLAAVIIQSMHGQSILVTVLTWGGLLLILACVILLLSRSGPRYEKRWRGRVVEEPETWYQRFKQRFRFSDRSSRT